MEKDYLEFKTKFDSLCTSYHDYLDTDNINKGSLLYFQENFLIARRKLLNLLNFFSKKWKERDDKSCSSYRARLALRIFNGEHETINKPSSFNRSGEEAYASADYEKFLEERAVYYATYNNLKYTLGTLESYINLIKDRLKHGGHRDEIEIPVRK